MANKLRIHTLVPKDLAAALDWYDGISIGLGNRFRSAVTQAITEIGRVPDRYPRAFDDADIRYRRVRKFLYLILYSIECTSIHIRGVVHNSSDPESWRARTKK